MTLIINATIYDFHRFATDQYVLFDQVILDCGPMSEVPIHTGNVVDAKGGLVMPGLINAHSHIYSTFARGLNVPFQPTNFVELLEQLWWKLDRNLTNEMTYYSGIIASVEHIKNGVTTVIDHHASGEIKGSLEALQKAVVKEANMRGAFCFETSDRFAVDEAIIENDTFLHTHNNSMTKGLFGMHAQFTLNEETLNKVSKKLHNHPIHIHVGESQYDEEHCEKQYGESIVERLHRHNLLTENSILAHCIYTNKQDFKTLAKHKTHVAVNVTSNMNNGVGLPDIKAMMDENVSVLIGNDGISFSMAYEYLSLYFAMHHRYQSPTVFTGDDLIRLIRNTYQYGSQLFGVLMGRIEPDFVADLVIVPYQPPTPLDEENIVGHLLFGIFHQFKPQHVFINGKQVLDNYKVKPSLEQSYRNAQSVAQKHWDSIAKEGTK